MSSWTLKSVPPHDFYICLDIEQYFDHEHDPETIFEEGFTRPVPLKERDILATVFFNGDPEAPEFHIDSPEALNKEEIQQANKSLARIFGTHIDLRPLYDQAADDPVLGPLLTELYGLKRMSRANLFEDTVNRIVQMRLSHKPTAKRMVYELREQYGTMLMHGGTSLPAWPRPYQLAKADPANIRKIGPTLRKGEYIVGLAQDLLGGNLDLQELETMSPYDFYDTISNVRGIGPTSAQDLMLFRERPDAYFPSHIVKKQEKGLRRWIILSYGGDPEKTSESEFQQMTTHWQGYEAAALEFLFVNWVLSEKERRNKEKK